MDAAMNTVNQLLDGRKILVTGAARGLGFAFAKQLALAGAEVVLADILEAQVMASAADLRASGLNATGVSIDVRDPHAVASAVSQAIEILGGLDGLVNNAAITNSGGKTTEELDMDTWNRVM
ncbi:SDR family NAD(P)-dependent oxidoreductase, partial [Wenyingzhuangia sp. 1_MG-2023]|nr:SDR family NAD(P)-dependent oxidoreductase [Wenyingzhuangia sp. 1_MG-2023]